MTNKDANRQGRQTAKAAMDNWLRSGLISQAQHNLMLRILAEGHEANGPTPTEQDIAVRIFAKQARDKEALTRELIEAKTKLDWNRAMLAKTKAALQAANSSLRQEMSTLSRLWQRLC